MLVVNLLIGLGSMFVGALISFLGFRFHRQGMLRKAENEAEVIKKNNSNNRSNANNSANNNSIRNRGKYNELKTNSTKPNN